VILGTGPSLTPELLERVAVLRQHKRIRVCGMNNTWQHYAGVMDMFTACDPQWWETYGHEFQAWRESAAVRPQAWHWDPAVAGRWKLRFIPGRWGDGLSLDPAYIHYGHSSSYQLINLAVLHGCTRLLLLGFDMKYGSGPRHYFNDLSDDAGEYPPHLRKWSSFTGLLGCYKTIADQQEKTKAFEIINCTPGSAMPWFPIKPLHTVEL